MLTLTSWPVFCWTKASDRPGLFYYDSTAFVAAEFQQQGAIGWIGHYRKNL